MTAQQAPLPEPVRFYCGHCAGRYWVWCGECGGTGVRCPCGDGKVSCPTCRGGEKPPAHGWGTG